MAEWRIEMLGRLALRDNTGKQAIQTKFYSQKTALLLVRLALPPMRVYGREELIDQLWPESDLANGRASLRNVLTHLRRQFASSLPDGRQALEADNGHIWLNSEMVETDVAAFEGLLKRAWRASGEGESEQALQEALSLYRGELMPGYYAEWLRLERDRLAAAHVAALRALRTLAERRKDARETRDLTFRLAQEDGDDAPQSPQPLLLSSPSLPTLYTRFFGRERESRELLALLNSSRLVTLTGMGGVGKTRLAQETATDFMRLSRSSAVFVPLEPARQAEHIVERIFAALAVSPTDQAEPITQVTKELTERNVHLLILDNFEHLLTPDMAARSLVAKLLKETARLHILITSRKALNLPGECAYPLTPLETPMLETPSEALMQVASVQMFADRARLARPDFAVTDRNADAVAAVCKQLEGIPLSLEIAAARVLVTTPWQMRVELEQRLSFLARRTAHGQSSATARHQSLRSALEWSHSLLSPALARCFAAFAAFRGGLTPESAREVCGDEDILGHIEELCQVSLLCPEERGEGMRFCFLDTIREFAHEKLTASGEENTIRASHFALFLRLADEADPALMGPDQQIWLDRLEADHDNLRTALDWALAQSDPTHALKLSYRLWRFWQTRGYLREGIEWLHKVLAKAGVSKEEDENRFRARAQNALGMLLIHANRFEEARAACSAAIVLFEECSPFDVIGPLNNLGLIHLYQSDYERAIEAFTRCLEIAAAHGETRHHSSFLNNRGMAFLHLGQTMDAEDDLRQALTLYREAGNQRGIAKALNNLGSLALQCGNPAQAEAPLRESLRLHYALGDREACALCLEGLAEWCLAMHEAARGAAMLGAAEAIRKEVNAPIRPVDAANYAKLRKQLLFLLGQTEFDSIINQQARQFMTTLKLEADIRASAEP